jgi:flagellar assembly factor FliW
MPLAQTEQFGPLDYSDGAALSFPRGLPGFEQNRRFLLIKQPDLAPLVHLQSLESAALCFLAIPVAVIEPAYQPQLSLEDTEVLGLDALDSAHALFLALLAVAGNGNVTANLLAPIVVNVATQTAVQAVRSDLLYSHEHVLTQSQLAGNPAGEQALCS